MARLRYNGLTAELGADLLTADTTITFTAALSSAAGAVPTLTTGDYIPLAVVDTDGGVLEIIHLTAYTSGATTGTVTRAQEGTTAADRASGLAVVNGLTIADMATTGAAAVGQELDALPMLGSTRSGNLTLGATSKSLATTTAHNGFPGLALCPDGSLLAVWREATNHNPTAVGVIKARKSTDKGLTWGTPYTVASDALDLRDPTLTTLRDGTLVLQCFKHDGTNGEGVYLATSTDSGATFSALVEVPFTFTLSTASSSRLVELTDGTWVVAAYGKNTGDTMWTARTIKSTNRGSSWTTEATIATGTRSYEEPYIGIRTDGYLAAVMRTSDNVLWRAVSLDSGASWVGLDRADGTSATLPNSGGRPAWISTRSGAWLLTYRSTVAPYPLQFAASWDNGASWSSSTQLGTTPTAQSVYAQPVEVTRGLVGVAYAVEDSLTAARVDFAYLIDGKGTSPLGDVNPPTSGGGTSVPFVRVRDNTASDISLPQSVAYANVNTGLDVVISAAAGDTLEIGANFIVSYGTASELNFEVATVVSSAIVNYCSGVTNGASGNGVPSWAMPTANSFERIGGSFLYTVVSGDLDGGQVRLRLLYKHSNPTAKSILRSASRPVQVWAKNLGQ